MAKLAAVELNRKNIGRLLKGDEIHSDLVARGRRVIAAAGAGVELEEFKGRNRWRITVKSSSQVRVGGPRERGPGGKFKADPSIRLRNSLRAARG